MACYLAPQIFLAPRLLSTVLEAPLVGKHWKSWPTATNERPHWLLETNCFKALESPVGRVCASGSAWSASSGFINVCLRAIMGVIFGEKLIAQAGVLAASTGY